MRLISWSTKTDRFDPGQWFHGRIYERRCDLSPDGSKFLYFASKQGKTVDAAYGSTWTAVSKPPYLTALALWPKGNAWDGGGAFVDDYSIWLNHRLALRVPIRITRRTGCE